MKDVNYESEFTRFIREYLDKNPDVVEKQRKNRATWWDRPQDPEVQHEHEAARVAQPAYVYFPRPRPAATLRRRPAATSRQTDAWRIRWLRRSP